MILEEKHFKDGEIRVNCKGTIRAEFWKKDVENILFNEQDRFLKVLEVAESQWPSKYLLVYKPFMICSIYIQSFAGYLINNISVIVLNNK